ncbi:MAG: helix-turn-helix domain-containing protein [Candidatus Promineifilaceae bacterium]
MSKYGQYCPVAKSLEILGDRWTLLIVRDLLTGTSHFNDLERGLPGISRALLSSRLRLLEREGVIEKQIRGSGRQTTEYRLTEAGLELMGVVGALRAWGTKWAFGEPTPEELDPVLLMWRLSRQVDVARLPNHLIVVQFDFYGAASVTFWLILTRKDVSICLTDPGYDVNMLVSADLAVFYKLWAERISYQEALYDYGVRVEGIPKLTRGFPDWFGWGMAHSTIAL